MSTASNPGWLNHARRADRAICGVLKESIRASIREDPRCGLLLVVLGALALVGATRVFAVADARQERLEAIGTTVQGTVIETDVPPRGPSTVTVRYRIEGRTYEERIVGSIEAYVEGQRVTVYVDRLVPSSATLHAEEPQSSASWYGARWLVFGGLAALALGIRCLWIAWRKPGDSAG